MDETSSQASEFEPSSDFEPSPADVDSPPPTAATLDAFLQSQFCGIVGLGCSRSTAADYLGLSPESVRETMSRDPQFALKLAEGGLAMSTKLAQQIIEGGDPIESMATELT